MRKILVLLAAFVFVFAACGDDSSSSDTTASGSGSGSGSGTEVGDAPVTLEGEVNNHGTEDAPGGEIDMEADNFYFGPTFVKATAGETVTVHLTNEGSAPHTFTIDGTDVDEELQPGDTADVEVPLPDSGATRFYCRFHAGQGMQGAFFFNEGDEVNA